MTAWLLSVAGVGILGVLVSVLTNKTRLHKVVRTACTYAFLLVLVFPLPSLITSVGSGSCGIFDEAPTYDEEVLDSVSSAYLEVVGDALDAALAEKGYVAESRLTGNATGAEVNVDSADVTLYGDFTDSASVILTVRGLVAEYLGIGTENVRVLIEQNG